MLVLRYFGYVGGALLAVLLVCAAMLPKPPPIDSTVASAAPEGPTIRIHSERKWPERIVLDTNAPMPAPPVRVAEGPLAPVPPEPAAKAGTTEALAQLPPERVAQLRKPETKVPRRRIARARFAPSRYAYAYAYAPSYYGYGRRTMQVAQQPHFGFFW